MYELSKTLAKAFLRRGVGFCVCDLVDACGRDLCSKPVCFGKASNERDEVLLDLLLRQCFANLVERINSLGEKVSGGSKVEL